MSEPASRPERKRSKPCAGKPAPGVDYYGFPPYMRRHIAAHGKPAKYRAAKTGK